MTDHPPHVRRLYAIAIVALALLAVTLFIVATSPRDRQSRAFAPLSEPVKNPGRWAPR